MNERWRYERAACQRKEERRREADDTDRQKRERHIQEEPAALRCSCCHGGSPRNVLLRSNVAVEKLPRSLSFALPAKKAGNEAKRRWRDTDTTTPIRPR